MVECRETSQEAAAKVKKWCVYADDTTLMAESEKLKSLLMKVKEESGNSWLKAQHSEN